MGELTNASFKLCILILTIHVLMFCTASGIAATAADEEEAGGGGDDGLGGAEAGGWAAPHGAGLGGDGGEAGGSGSDAGLGGDGGEAGGFGGDGQPVVQVDLHDVAEDLLQGALEDAVAAPEEEEEEEEEEKAAERLVQRLGLSGEELAYILAGLDSDGDEFEGEPEAAEGDDEQLPDFNDPSWERPLFDGSRITVGRFIYALLKEKRAGKIRDTVFNRLLVLLQGQVFPAANLAPKSFHMLKKALAVEAAGNFEYHVCAHGEYAFPDACGRQDYHLHEHEVCTCAQPVSRFKRDNKGKLQPHAVSEGEWGPITLGIVMVTVFGILSPSVHFPPLYPTDVLGLGHREHHPKQDVQEPGVDGSAGHAAWPRGQGLLVRR